METKQEISDKKERKKMASCAGKNMFSSMSSYGWIPFYFLSSIILLILALFPFGPWSKKGFKLACNWSSIFKHLAIVSLQTRAKKNPSRGRNLCFHTRYSNRNILSFWYQNQAIQKPKFIYASRTTTLMKESKWDKIILENRIWQ